MASHPTPCLCVGVYQFVVLLYRATNDYNPSSSRIRTFVKTRIVHFALFILQESRAPREVNK